MKILSEKEIAEYGDKVISKINKLKSLGIKPEILVFGFEAYVGFCTACKLPVRTYGEKDGIKQLDPEGMMTNGVDVFKYFISKNAESGYVECFGSKQDLSSYEPIHGNSLSYFNLK